MILITLFGWDCSDYDYGRGPMDLKAAKAAGISFFTHKAIETSTNGTFKHKHYKEMLNRAKAAGIPFYGAYVVVRSGNVTRQVDAAIAYVTQQTPWFKTDPNWFWQVDLEKWPYDTVPALNGVEMARQLTAKTGKKVIIYASKGQYGNSIPGNDPLWNANYGSNPVGEFKQIYKQRGGDKGAGWTAYSGQMPEIWQYGSRTTIGTQKTCDANAYRGTLEQFRKLVSSGPTPPVAPSVPISLPKPPQAAPKPPITPENKPIPVKKWPGVAIGPTGSIIAEIVSYYPRASEIYITSAYRPNDTGSHHSGLRYNGHPTAAVDFGFGGVDEPAKGKALADWLWQFRNKTVELIHSSPLGGRYVKHQQPVPPYAVADHYNHVHFATTDEFAKQILAVVKMSYKGDDMPLTPADVKLIVDELLKWENLKVMAQAFWDVDYVPSGRPDNTTWQGKTVLGYTMNVVEDVNRKLNEDPEVPETPVS